MGMKRERLTQRQQELLVAAASLITNYPERWIKGDYINDEDNTYCAIGAVQTAVQQRSVSANYLDEDESAVANALVQHLPVDFVHAAALSPYPEVFVEGFNDAEATTYEDVKALFCRTVRAEVTDGDT